MEIKVQKSDLVRKIALGVNIAGGKPSTLPILNNLLLETRKEGGVKVVATDMEVGISATLPAEIAQNGSITVPARKFYDIVKELPEGEIDISVTKNNTVNIKCGKSYFKIMGLDKEDFPKLPAFSLDQAIEIEQSVLKECLTLTSFAISHDETRYVLNGVLVSFQEGGIRFVATDGRRLAFYKKEIKKKINIKNDMIIPAKTIHELLKLLEWDGVIKITQSQNKIIFVLDDTYLSSSLIEGNFPNYEQVIPKEEKTTAVVNREELLQAVRRASLLTSSESPALKFDFIKGKALVSAKSPNMGEAKEELPAEFKGQEITIGFNPNYLMDVLKNLTDENITISLTEPDKPGLVKGREGYLYVIMPMQLN
ncbi:MAG TPA: DNA polymerase III subunit beta [Candidatus Omnitrophota bacterium]|nr:MAG: DNA polymerase III subunit beta [Candidatus Omnitrophica bacterium ADurb.Bin314]HQB94164.1 DNA polymerase III subunit beta [Candidatus Omnitrophota bacterium]